MKNTGLTLIEIMIVVAILGILAAIVYPAYLEYSCKGSFTADCKAIRDKKQKPIQQKPVTQCSSGLLFDTSGRQIIGVDGRGVACQ